MSLVLSRPSPTLLDIAKAGPADRVLVIGGDRLGLLCAALRRGCRSAVAMVAPPHHPDAADLVVAPGVTSAEEAEAVAESARRALPPGGRLAIGLKGAAASMGREVGRALQAHGFRRARLRARAEGGVLLTCRVPEREAAR
ncbi:hypothetical protein [Rhodovarius lipocyclicus]|uniref:hypothetical protein n=1 Tax=Rhodovarius lipocyclicus TaxID=268410 RepID=UPI001359FFAD|nr:hypothetical protein [Rhodovarius lipocyclicus]